MKSSHGLRLWFAAVVMAGLALACNFPGLVAPGTPVGTPSPEVPTSTPFAGGPAPTWTPAPPTDEVTPESTPSPTEEVEEEECVLRAAFVEDVTIPDDTEVEPDEEFVKTWRIRNPSDCPWPVNTSFVPVGGDDLGGMGSVSVPALEPEEETEVSVTLTAPTEPGTYRSNWQLETPEGQRFGGVFYAQIVVPGAEPTPSVTPEVEGADLPRELLASVSDDCDEVTFTWIDAEGESAYRLEGPDLNVDLDADATDHTWEDPPDGVSTVALIAEDEDGEVIGRIETAVGVTCGDAQPDLTVTDLAFDPEPPVAHLPVMTTVEITNEGNADSGGFIVERWDVKAAPSSACRWVVEEGLTAGASLTLDCTTVPYTSSYTELITQVTVDPTRLVPESDETNNLLETTIDVAAPESSAIPLRSPHSLV